MSIKKSKREIKPTRVPTLLSLFFIIFIGIWLVVFSYNIPGKVEQYYVNKNLVENGQVVDAVFEKSWINENVDAPNYWSYRLEFCYIDSNNIHYSIVIRSGQDTDIDALEGKTVKILIDGKGNCIREGTTKGNLITDILLYVLLCLFFFVWWFPFVILFIKNIRFHVYNHKLKKQKENPDYSQYFQ